MTLNLNEDLSECTITLKNLSERTSERDIENILYNKFGLRDRVKSVEI